MISAPAEKFVTELDALVDRWRDKPDDDLLCTLEMVGAFEVVKGRLLREAYEATDAARSEADQ